MKAESRAVLLPRTVLETGLDKDIELEGNLAEYLPGINRVIRTEANLIPEEVQINGTKAEVKGKAVFSLLYESDYKGKLKSERYTTDFAQKFDIGELPKGEYYPTVNCNCSYVSCKTLNPRKFILRCRGDIRLWVYSRAETQAVACAEAEDAFFKKCTLKFSEKSPLIRRDFTLDERFSLEGYPPVSDIVYASLHITPFGTDVSEGGAVLRCNGIFKCLYEAEEDMGLKLVEKRFTPTFSIDDEEIYESSMLSVHIFSDSCEVLKEQDNYGENRILTMSAAVTVNADCYNEKELELPTDMFFEKYDCSSEKGKALYEDLKPLPPHKLLIEKTIEVPELPFEECIDVNGEGIINEVTVENGICNVVGTCNINILGKEENRYQTYDLNVGFNEQLALQQWGLDSKIKAKANIACAEASINNGRINIKLSGELECIKQEKHSISIITEGEIVQREAVSDADSTITVYYPDKGETAWDIGKRFYTSPNTIVEKNPEAFDGTGTITEKGSVIFI